MSRKKLLLLVMSSVVLFAGTAPQVGDTFELQAWLNARSAGLFRSSDKNIQRVLKPGTKGRIQKASDIKRFSSGNYGICLTIEGSSDCSWVYYRVRQPNMKLVSRNNEPTRKPESAVAATVLVPTPVVAPALPANSSLPASPALPAADSVWHSPVSTEANSILQNALNRTSLVTGYQTPVTSGPAAECVECELQRQARDNQCTHRNGYLEKELQQEKDRGSLLGQLMSGAVVRPTIKLACVSAALSINSGSKFKNCEPGDKRFPWLSKTKPCQSENYTKAIYNSINLVSECFKGLNSSTQMEYETRSEMNTFLMMWESGLQMNAVSGTGAGGMGQLTQPAIADTNRLYYDKIKDHFAHNANPLCQRLASETLANKMSAQKTAACERIAVSQGSPLKNLIYTFGYQMMSRDHLNQFVFSNPQIQRYFSDLSASDRERLQTSLTIWSHNTGAGGMQTPLLSFLNSRARSGHKLTANEIPQFFADLKTQLKDNPHPANSSSGRRTETSLFLGKIMDRAANIIESAGGTCLAQ